MGNILTTDRTNQFRDIRRMIKFLDHVDGLFSLLP